MSQHRQERKHHKLQMWWGEQVIYSGFKFVSGGIVSPTLLWSAARWKLSPPSGPVISVTPADVGSTTVELDPVIDYSGLQITQDHWTSSKKQWKQAACRAAAAPVPWSRSPGDPQLLLDVPHTRSWAEPHSQSGYSQMWTQLSSYPSLVTSLHRNPEGSWPWMFSVIQVKGLFSLALVSWVFHVVSWRGFASHPTEEFWMRPEEASSLISSINHKEVQMT